jgi:hypothetical protein
VTVAILNHHQPSLFLLYPPFRLPEAPKKQVVPGDVLHGETRCFKAETNCFTAKNKLFYR